MELCVGEGKRIFSEKATNTFTQTIELGFGSMDSSMNCRSASTHLSQLMKSPFSNFETASLFNIVPNFEANSYISYDASSVLFYSKSGT